MYRLTKDPDILLCIETGAFIPRDHYLWPTKWLESNTPLPVPPPYELHSPEHYRVIRAAAWDWMAAEVHERGYDSIETCVGYYNSSVDRYRLEARAMVAWRDAVNQALEALVKAPPAGVETWEQVLVLLPQPSQFNWPSRVEFPLGVGDGPAVQL
ncbi:hypothetical protein IMCGPPIG_01919 [Stenotrophomonas maltophilia]|uniref:hypothetical protein n=1 Tax=Stenotrophomonas TaxID=40323 RepID=UPI000621AD0D|nr:MULTISPECIES: hypothetical protein [unclassified Stenotrophomonas]KKF88323.1 hypothetical protein XY58_09870 [Stenotrophomonas maltophilia]MBA0255769.1 hypothetical protein [Stenotrophomonas maltophilia]MBA0452134.1 hypothetical protein [Stenotrophomonas maltophilia]MBA0480412.1 hypothetical protein [Stenotrophomonas maltophilia]MBA0489696.1 hypothetical protein [Stenotrophomonas maltophilia]